MYGCVCVCVCVCVYGCVCVYLCYDMPMQGTFSGHKGCIYCVCMRTGSQQFITGGEDGAVYVWGQCFSARCVTVVSSFSHFSWGPDPSASNSPVHTIKAGDVSSV